MRTFVSISVFVFVLGLGASAQAQSPIGLEVSGHVQYGIGVNGVDGFPSTYGFGFGARAGLRLPMSLYAGALIDYNIGSSEETTILGNTADISGNSFVLGVEAGYDLSLQALRIRPRVGIGFVDASLDLDVGNLNAAGSGSSFLLFPGLTALFEFSDTLFAGAELTLFVPTENLDLNEKSVTIGANFGAHF